MSPRRAHLIRRIAFAALLLAGAHDAFSQVSIVLNNTRGLDFGRFAASNGGIITIGTTGMRSKSGSVVLLTSPGASPATFNVSKSSTESTALAVLITLPSNNTVTLSNGASSMAVNDFICSPASIASVPDTGLVLSVGASLTVGAGQPGGAYSGAFNLTVNYQ